MSAAALPKRSGFDASAMAITAICLGGLFWSILAAADGADAAMRIQAWLIGGGFLLGLFAIVGIYGEGGVETLSLIHI